MLALLMVSKADITLSSFRISIMNQINPNKLLLSKWTAIEPKNKERHFLVTKLIRSESEEIIACELEAVINHKVYEINWQDLKNAACWQIGWR